MRQVTIYTKISCPYCIRAKQLLSQQGATNIHEIFVDLNADQLADMIARTNKRTVPQIFIEDHYVGGCDDLERLHNAGQLKPLLTP